MVIENVLSKVSSTSSGKHVKHKYGFAVFGYSESDALHYGQRLMLKRVELKQITLVGTFGKAAGFNEITRLKLQPNIIQLS